MLTNVRYLRHSKAVLLNEFLGYVVWTSLAAFMVMAKNAIGANSVPIFELLIFVAGIFGTKLAHSKYVSYTTSIRYTAIIESVFLVTIYLALLKDNLPYAGISVYMVIIFNAVSNRAIVETSRVYEDSVLSNIHYKKYLKLLRKRSQELNVYGGVIGTSIAVIVITHLGVSIVSFAMVMLILNVVSNMYEHYLWYKYLR